MRVDRVKFAAAVARADISGGQLAERASLSRGTVTAVKNGKSCSRETALKLASALGMQVEELLEGVGA